MVVVVHQLQGGRLRTLAGLVVVALLLALLRPLCLEALGRRRLVLVLAGRRRRSGGVDGGSGGGGIDGGTIDGERRRTLAACFLPCVPSLSAS